MKRKDRVKNVAIIFLGIMLVLTLFSNTIMNYSLVEVSTQQIYGDSITTKVRGSGSVEASENYTVSIKESRKIATVNVRTGAEVAQGDVLFTLEDADSEELKTARKTLSDAESTYESAVLEAGLTVAERQAIESGHGSSLTDKQNSLATAQAAVDNAQAAVDNIQKQIDALGSKNTDTTAEELAVLNAERAMTSATDNKNGREQAYQSYSEAYEEAVKNNAPDVEQLKTLRDAAQQDYDNAVNAYNDAKKALDDANYALSVKKLQGSGSSQSEGLQAQLDSAKQALTDATEDYDKANAKVKAEISIASQYRSIQELRNDVSKLESNAIGAEITAPIAGTVTEISCTAGKTVTPEEPMMLIQPENKAFTLKFTVTANQARRIKAGDRAEVLNNWYGNDISARVMTIHRDPNNKESSVVTCEMSGDISVGDYYTLSIGEQSSNYDLVVPTSSIREDANGNFILIIESKSTPLGNRYYARRVDVDIITSDDTKSAISGALEGYEYVITTTTKPVEANQQVRLAD